QGRGILQVNRDGARIDMASCWVDAVALLQTFEQAPEQSDGHELRIAADRLLEDLDGLSPSLDQWLAAERSQLGVAVRQEFEGALARFEQDDVGAERRAAVARRLFAFDATHEGATRLLMRGLVERGEPAQAIREYERCRRVLKLMLDV